MWRDSHGPTIEELKEPPLGLSPKCELIRAPRQSDLWRIIVDHPDAIASVLNRVTIDDTIAPESFLAKRERFAGQRLNRWYACQLEYARQTAIIDRLGAQTTRQCSHYEKYNRYRSVPSQVLAFGIGLHQTARPIDPQLIFQKAFDFAHPECDTPFRQTLPENVVDENQHSVQRHDMFARARTCQQSLFSSSFCLFDFENSIVAAVDDSGYARIDKMD